ncbi:UNVERIFIED_CONTAM: hypothetical protein K2H54_057293 [Gekko kuhli]
MAEYRRIYVLLDGEKLLLIQKAEMEGGVGKAKDEHLAVLFEGLASLMDLIQEEEEKTATKSVENDIPKQPLKERKNTVDASLGQFRLLESWIETAQALTHPQLRGILVKEQFFQALSPDIAILVQVHNPASLSDMALFADQLAMQLYPEPKTVDSWELMTEEREKQ